MKKLFIVFLILSGVGFAGLYYSWRQATHLPEWYSPQSNNTQNVFDPSNSSERLATQARLQEKIEARIAKAQEISPNKNVEIELSNTEVNELVTTTIAQEASKRPVLATVRTNHTTIKDGVLESGAVVNLDNLPRNQLNESELAALDKIQKTFPFLNEQDVYVGIAGKPQIEMGQVKWDSSTKVKLGNLSLSLNELSQRLGIPAEQLEQTLNLSLPLGSLKVNDMELTNDKLLLKGSVE